MLFSDLPNFAPVAALALFAGYFFRSRLIALFVPLLVMAISDCFIGRYSPQMMALVYAALAAPVLWRAVMRQWLDDESATAGRSTAAIATGSLAGSLLFFLTTNLGCWLWFDMYDHNWAGLGQCYLQAMPFFRYTLAGDLCFAIGLFGGHAAVIRWGWLADSGRRVILSRESA